MAKSVQTHSNNADILWQYEIAVLIPCFNEAVTIAKVVEDFKTALPMAKIYVYDNNSSDHTASVATAAGAIVRYEPHQGKGHVVKRMFADIDADIYLMVDGDATYDASVAPIVCLRLIQDNLDMIVVARKETAREAYGFGHIVGNLFATKMMRFVIGGNFSDILSGYRAFSKRFVKSLPLESKGFEIETELTIYAIRLEVPTTEMQAAYFPRPPGSISKLKSLADSWKILSKAFYFSWQHKPLFISRRLSLVLFLVFFVMMILVLLNSSGQGKIIESIIMVGALVASLSSLFSGAILHAISLLRHDNIQLKYQSYPRFKKKHEE